MLLSAGVWSNLHRLAVTAIHVKSAFGGKNSCDDVQDVCMSTRLAAPAALSTTLLLLAAAGPAK
jgi:hypothetical protein